MRPASLRRVAVAVATGRVAAVFLEDNEVIGWCRSAKAFADTTQTGRIVRGWVDGFRPDQALVEDVAGVIRKGPQSQAVIDIVASVFSEAHCLDVRVRRYQTYDNKYDEAMALTKQFPAIKSLLPKRPPIWLPEPRNMTYFEALALVQAVIKPVQSEATVTQ